MKLCLGLGLNKSTNAGGGGVSGSSFLSEEWAGVQGHFDATISESYGGTGTEYVDVIGGTTATLVNTTFTGTAGSSDGRFVLNGNAYWYMNSLPDSLKQVQRTDTGQKFTIIHTFRYPSSGVLRNFANAQATTEIGVKMAHNVGSTNVSFDYFNGAVLLPNNLTISNTATFATNNTYVTHIYVFSADRTTIDVYANSATASTATRLSLTLNIDASLPYYIHSTTNASAKSPNGTEDVTWAWGAGEPSSIANVFSAFNTAHNRTYV